MPVVLHRLFGSFLFSKYASKPSKTKKTAYIEYAD